ncbi:MarR family winged helix-turn-helix transcriptional regulator [Sphingobium sp. B11D3D]|uniref:MarR family winged helix-turn-helix transcriptional regulator n=1 Tax=Sphingobium sp. B11D3D TaxID=2940576 RepID=UPI002224451C|nr:MarR family transcriptional regulator [Sphingobium sp. B11D3D]MCW2369080.1 DNA-binding MarR family transcriptional regulator [Sphingobium sp. B11D3D]
MTSRPRSTGPDSTPSSQSLAHLRAESEAHRLDAAVDALIGEWQAVIPALDSDVRAIAARVARIDDRLRAETAAVLKASGLSDNEFRLLAGLMRIGAPYRAAPTDLAGRYVPVTSGGLTGLARRLEQRGLIRRVSHASDQRSLLIELTPDGIALAGQTMAAFTATEQLLMGSLTQADRQRCNAILRKLLHSIEAALP